MLSHRHPQGKRIGQPARSRSGRPGLDRLDPAAGRTGQRHPQGPARPRPTHRLAGQSDCVHEDGTLIRSVGDTKTEEPESLLVAPRPPHPQDNWLELIGAGAAGGFTGAVGADAYKGVKAACQAAVKKFRGQPSDPEEEAEWVPGSMATYEQRPGCDLHWLVMAYGSVDRAFADDGRDDIDQACAAHGATYDGGGMYVG